MAFDVMQVRSRFPALNQPTSDGALPVFFDNPAGTQVPDVVIDAVSEFFRTMYALPGGHFATSQRSARAMEEARAIVADFLNAAGPHEIVFGPNMTTLNFHLSRSLAAVCQPGDEVVVTRMDHDANVSPWLTIARDFGLTVRYVDIRTEDCTLDMNSLEAALTDRTKIVATVHASNAVGTINPVSRIAQMAHAAGAYHIVDAVQSAPHIPIDVQAIGCDFLLCSAYKFFAPHIGVMWGRADLLEKLPVYKVRPAKDEIPYRWENGMTSFETVYGTASALQYLAGLADGEEPVPGYTGRRLRFKQAMSAIQRYEQGLVAHLIAGLQQIPRVRIYGITDPDRCHERVPTVSFVVEGVAPDQVGQYLADHDIYLWTGNYYALEIMQRLGYEGMVRVGLAHYNTREEIDRLLTALQGFVTRQAGA